MKKERRTFSQEFKREAVSLVAEEGYSCAEAGRSRGGERSCDRALEAAA